MKYVLNLIQEEVAKGKQEQHHIEEQGVLPEILVRAALQPWTSVKKIQRLTLLYLFSFPGSFRFLEMSHCHSCNVEKEPGQDARGFQCWTDSKLWHKVQCQIQDKTVHDRPKSPEIDSKGKIAQADKMASGKGRAWKEKGHLTEGGRTKDNTLRKT